MTTTTISYGASTVITITLASLATSAAKLVGQESTAVVNTTNKFIDAYVGGKVTTGTTPTAAKTIEVWVYGAVNDTPTYPDVLDGTDSGETFTDDGAKFSALKLGAVANTDATSDQTYWFAPFSVAQLFGGILPTHWGLFVTHDTGVNLNATGTNHEFKYTGIKFDIA